MKDTTSCGTFFLVVAFEPLGCSKGWIFFGFCLGALVCWWDIFDCCGLLCFGFFLAGFHIWARKRVKMMWSLVKCPILGRWRCSGILEGESMDGWRVGVSSH